MKTINIYFAILFSTLFVASGIAQEQPSPEQSATVGAGALAPKPEGTVRIGVVTLHPFRDPRRGGQVDRRTEQLQHEATAVPHAVGVGYDFHAGLNLAGA